MKVKEMIKLLKTYPEDMELLDVGYDRGHGYTREVISEIGGVKKDKGGLVFVTGEEATRIDKQAEKAELVQTYIDMINKERKGY